MKKKLTIFLAAMLLVTAIGCGDQNPTDSSSGASESVTAPSETGSETGSEPASEEKKKPITAAVAIKDVFAKHNMKVGTCITGNMTTEKAYKDRILKHFNSITMENSMKPDSTLNRDESIKAGKLVYGLNNDAIQCLEFAKENGLGVRGHTLVWYSQTPNWIFYEDFDESKQLVSREVMLDRLENCIKDVFQYLKDKGYSDLFYAFDVANECWMEDGSMRQNNWKTTIGDDYLWYAFYYADKYAPENIDLYYNDYNEQFKTDTLVKFVKTLVDENGKFLIDGVGFQAHLYTQDDLDQYFKTMDAVAATGLKIQLTELDVCLGEYQKPGKANEKNFKAQGRFYYELINGIFERVDAGTVKSDALTLWGFTDKYSWRGEYSPLLFDTIFVPKYAYFGVVQDKEFAGY